MTLALNDLRNRRNAIIQLAAQHGASNVRVFGSVARGESCPSSDVDMLVNFESGRSLLDQAALERMLEEFLDCKVDVVAEGGISPYLEERILSEAIPL